MELLDVLRRHALLQPDKIAVVGSQATLTYRELNDLADAVAEGFRGAGIEPGDRVGLLLGNDLAFLAAYAGIRRARGVVVPMNLRLSVDEVLHQLDDSGARLALVQDDWAHLDALRAEASAPVVPVASAGLPDPAQLAAVTPRPSSVTAPADLERIMYTSGTTARPKGVMLTTEQNLRGALIRCVEFGLTAADVTLTVAPLYHVGGLDSYTMPMLLAGGTTVLLPKFDAEAVLDLVSRHQVTCTWLPPTLIRELFAAVDRGVLADPSSLRVILGGGEKAPAPLLERLAAEWPTAGYYDCFGMTECQGMATYLPAPYAQSHLGSVGPAAFEREVRIADDDGNPAAVGEPGEVELAGPLVTPGYWQNDAATAAAFNGRWFRTGDIGRLDDNGFLTIVDRKKDMIRSGLENVSSSEIERVLYRHPAVDQAAVVARPDARWGEVPVAFVVVRSTTGAEELREFCRDRLAAFKVPAVVEFVDELPRTASGKIQKHRLRERFTPQ